ncbi:MAG: carbamoyltransferase HypF, partial [Nitriliruptorales bacterium]
MERERRRIRVTGTVQGVGFRPFVYRLAVELGLVGSVANDHAGVIVEAEGAPLRLDELCRRLAAETPPLAHVASLTSQPLPPTGMETSFEIVTSVEGGAPDVPVSVDVAPCVDCLAELADPQDRRFAYPFINCTNCGPRYTIVRRVPYDRPFTTMATFRMCAACQAEYDDPLDRRFHAQPNACPACGPRLVLSAPSGQVFEEGARALDDAATRLVAGEILAVKGLGGYHLATDATNATAVKELRRRKARDDKPFAVMVADLLAARGLCLLAGEAEEALTSPRRPIVLAPRRTPVEVAEEVAPGLPELGLMLPYTPLHVLLLERVGRPLVMTSGNLSDEPIAHTDDDAFARLGPLVDAVLSHDRGIHIRCDDSVVRASIDGHPQLARRSRGYAPEPLPLPRPGSRQVLAVGAELKSTVTVTKGDLVVVSHHIGDLEHYATYRSFLQAVDHLCHLFGVEPEVVAHDLHPEYLS